MIFRSAADRQCEAAANARSRTIKTARKMAGTGHPDSGTGLLPGHG